MTKIINIINNKKNPKFDLISSGMITLFKHFITFKFELLFSFSILDSISSKLILLL